MYPNNRSYEVTRKPAAARTPQRTTKSKDRSAQRQNRIRVLQLTVSLALFLVVFIGKGVFPSKMAQVQEEMLAVLTAQTNFRALLSNLGTSISQGNSFYETLEDFCVEVFGREATSSPSQNQQAVPQLTNLFSLESHFLSGTSNTVLRAEHYQDPSGPCIQLPKPQAEPKAEEKPPEPAKEEEPPKDAVAAVGTVLLKSDYKGQALPEKYTMDWISFGALETTTPVMGRINSIYGYRNHPIKGNYQFHGGLDIGGQAGDPIHAFAAGKVDYVGENDSYGLYLQLDHGNGIKSFYAHCKSVCVKKGQAVTLGQTIATVGSSGSATGPHLHLELKYNGIHLDPSYYVESLSQK